MKNIIVALTMLFTMNAFACNMTQEQKDTAQSNGYWEEFASDYEFPPVPTDWMTANGLWGTNYDN